MARSSTSLSASSYFPSPQRTYDVFLSFKGEDTRQGFTAFLHRALCDRGINAFMDNNIRRGDQISSALLNAIEESRFYIIILSENYAYSSWCLDELAQILDYVKWKRHTAIPVFYDVDPSVVRRQTGSYGEALKDHELSHRAIKHERLKRWRNALTEVSNISGYDARQRFHTDVIDEIVWLIIDGSVGRSLLTTQKLVGMDSRIADVAQLMCPSKGDIKIIAIWGMPGIGKTALAIALYNRYFYEFKDGCCFLREVRAESLKHGTTFLIKRLYSEIFKLKYPEEENFSFGLMKERLKSRRVLIVLDDVDKVEQIQDLVGDPGCYGHGSRIIITTRDKALLLNNRVDCIVEPRRLDDEETSELFWWHACHGNPLADDYKSLLKEFYKFMNGLPLAIKVLGSFLNGQPLDDWKEALKDFKRTPHPDIMKVLKISFDGLGRWGQGLFLDIACFCEGQDINFVAKILEDCEFSQSIGIKELDRRCLVFVSNNKLCMHNLLQEMGREIVQCENVKFPGERSRLWFHDEVNDVLTTDTGSKNVEGIVLDLSALNELHLSVSAFKNMNLLRVLRFFNAKMDGCLEYLSKAELIGPSYDGLRWRVGEMLTADKVQSNCTLHLDEDFMFPSKKLRSLCWHGCPLKSLPTNFYSEMLVELNMCSSLLEQLWEGNKPLKNLSIVKLSHSKYLSRTPDFSEAPNISRLILEGCASLVEVHPSIGALKKLIFLNLEGCKNLEYFPSIFHMKSLEILILSGCSKLEQFPEIPENSEGLKYLFLDGTALSELPSSIGNLIGLVLLNLTNCKKLLCLPQSICELMSLRILTVAGCSQLKELPNELGRLRLLEELNADGCGTQVATPLCTLLTNLLVLPLAGCLQLQSLFNVVFPLWSSRTRCLSLHFLSNLSSLKTLTLSDCNLLEDGLPGDLSSLSSLEKLDLSKNDFFTVPTCLGGLSQLKHLFLMHCSKLQSVREGELPLSIEEVCADHCSSLETFSFPLSAFESNNMGHFTFTFSGCFKLVENEPSDTLVGDIIEGIKAAASIRKFFDHDIGGGPSNTFQAIVPGNSIPEWFVYQNKGSALEVPLPMYWYNIGLMGLAACVVFNADVTLDVCYLNVSVYCGEYRYSDNVFSTLIQMEGDLVWFGYQSLARLEESRGSYMDPLYLLHPMRVSFSLSHCSSSLVGVVKRCGFRLVYEEGGRVWDGVDGDFISHAKVPENCYRFWNPIHADHDVILSEGGSP